MLSRHLTEEKIRSYNIPQLQEAIQESQVQLHVSTYKWGESGDVDASSSTVASIIGVGLSFFSYLFMMTYGGMVLQGVLEEKKNRIVEVIISSVRPQELMLGKIIGIGLLGRPTDRHLGHLVLCRSTDRPGILPIRSHRRNFIP